MFKIFRVLGKKGRVTIPFEIRKLVGFKYNDILSFTASDDFNSVTIKKEKICDDCNEEPKTITKPPQKEKTDDVTLLDFIDNLTPEQQRATLVHLTLKWAEAKGEN